MASAVAATALLTSACTPVPPTPGVRVGLRRVAEGFTSPVALATAPGDGQRMYVVDQVGLIRVFHAESGLEDEAFLDVRSRMIELSPTYDERGLLGLAFHPQFASNGKFYVVYNAPLDEDGPEGFDDQWRLSEFVAAAEGAADLASERILLRVDKPQFNHNGGQLAFGSDGMLYVSIGDGGGANDRGTGHNAEIGNGQDLSTLLGKVLRIDVDSAGEQAYGIPDDNPFVGVEGARPEIWAYGLRNPWRFSFDQGGGQRLFLADAGQDLYEEVDIITRGGNYGWRIKEGFACFNVNDPGDPLDECPDEGADGAALIDPILQLAHTSSAGVPLGTVVIGGYVYRGSELPELRGGYVFGDFTTVAAFPNGQLYVAEENDDGSWTSRRLRIAGTSGGAVGKYVLAFGQDQAGEVYVLATGSLGPVGQSGVVYRLEQP